MLQGNWQEFTTESVFPAHRAKRWSEFGSDTLSDMTVDPLDKSRFRARIQRTDLGALGFVCIESTPALARSSATKTASWASPHSDSLVMTVADQGNCTLRQGKFTAELSTGDIAIRDLTKPWESYSATALGLILIKIPFSTAAKYHPDPEQLVGCRLSVSNPAVAFASSVIRASRHAIQADPNADWHEYLSDVLADIFRLICHGTVGRDQRSEGDPTCCSRREAMTYISRNLSDPELTVCDVANALGVSTRHLQRLFLAAGITPRQYILEERLKLAADKLARSADADCERIIDIAFSLGFNDASHFSRAFGHHFGCSPREYRRRVKAC